MQPDIEIFFDEIESRTVFTDIRDLLAEWRHAAREDGGLPHIERFGHHLAGDWGANLMVLRHERGDFHYDFVGKQIAVLFGHNPTGRSLSELGFAGSQIYRQRYKYSVETRAPLFAVQRKISFGIPGANERLVVPVRYRGTGTALLIYLRSRADNYDIVRAVFDTSQNGILVVSAVRDETGDATDFQITAINAAGAAFFAGTPDTLVGRRLMDLLPSRDFETVWPDLTASLQTGETRIVEQLKVSTSSGGIYRISSARVADGLAITISDLTQLQKAMQTLETQHASLVKVNAELRSEVVRRRRLEAELKQLASTDPLTGIANRRSFTEAMGEGLASANGTAALILFDIDDFKAINDRYGHPAGDRVLQDIAGTISKKFGTQGVFGRLGGEEFGVFLLDTSEEDVCRIAEDLRQEIYGAVHDVANGPIRVTASFGVKTLRTPCDEETLMALADEALYRAKRSGRNRVECHCACASTVDAGAEQTA